MNQQIHIYAGAHSICICVHTAMYICTKMCAQRYVFVYINNQIHIYTGTHSICIRVHTAMYMCT